MSYIGGIFIGIVGQGVSSLGLVLQKRAHVNNMKRSKDLRKRWFKDPIWWIAFIIFFGGNMCQVVALTLANQTVIAPLVVLVLVYNAIFAPLILHEILRPLDVVGMAVTISGVILILIFGPNNTREYTVNQMNRLWYRGAMIAYLGVIGVIVAITMTFVLIIPYRDPEEKYKELSTKAGKASGALFAVLPAILSSFNALFSKIVGELIYNSLFRTNQLDRWQFWIYLICLAIVNTLQVIFLQKALRSYSALFIIPVYQVSLNIAGVVVGGIYFKEFNQFSYLPPHYPVLFVIGIITSVIGVFILAQRQDSRLQWKESEIQVLGKLEFTRNDTAEFSYPWKERREISLIRKKRSVGYWLNQFVSLVWNWMKIVVDLRRTLIQE